MNLVTCIDNNKSQKHKKSFINWPYNKKYWILCYTIEVEAYYSS